MIALAVIRPSLGGATFADRCGHDGLPACTMSLQMQAGISLRSWYRAPAGATRRTATAEPPCDMSVIRPSSRDGGIEPPGLIRTSRTFAGPGNLPAPPEVTGK
jgi:hypothetical protein